MQVRQSHLGYRCRPMGSTHWNPRGTLSRGAVPAYQPARVKDAYLPALSYPCYVEWGDVDSHCFVLGD